MKEAVFRIRGHFQCKLNIIYIQMRTSLLLKKYRLIALFIVLFGLNLFQLGCTESSSSYAAITEVSPEEIIGKHIEGAKIFELQCARCHGINGAGSSAPSLQRKELNSAPDNEALFSIIKFGIPGSEMPGTWLLSDEDIKLLAGYVRSLGSVATQPIPGDAVNGRMIYDTKGSCTTCHMIEGFGGSLGPDLTNIGSVRAPEYIKKTLLTPGFDKEEGALANTSDGFLKYLMVEIITNKQERYKGMRVNQDAFSIQIKDVNNQINSLRMKEIKSMNKLYGESFMPSVAEVLSAEEIDDLVAYLSNRK